MPISDYSGMNIYPNDIVDPDEVVEEPEIPSEPEPIYGTFTCATYNVDGLPSLINSDGPGSSKTKTISSKLAASNWDFIGFSEDFEYHSELTSSMSNYNFGEHRGSVGMAQLVSKANTDGLGFAWKKNDINASKVDYIEFSKSHGGLFDGANTCIAKGIRHYEVTIAEGVVIDVLTTHMNTYDDDDEYKNTQHAQLKQIAEYINTIIAKNHRPVIFMGDTNCRYTRHDFKTHFWDILTPGLYYNDPWVDTQWNGVYPTYGTPSLVVDYKYDANNTVGDIKCDNQKGEVVDKIIYINDPQADTFILANSYLHDTDNYQGLADHCPIVVEFMYEKIN